MGGVSVERQPAEPEPGPVDAGQPAVDAAATAEGDQPEDKAETAPKSPYAGPETADLSVKGGESATLHDPSPPTDVRVPLDKCEHGGAVEIKRRGARGKYFRVGGDKSAVLRLPAGSYLYRVRCASRPGASPGSRPRRSRPTTARSSRSFGTSTFCERGVGGSLETSFPSTSWEVLPSKGRMSVKSS
mgnify:CR=1 FL=1